MPTNDYKQLLFQYPEYISKEQFYKLAHISKRSAQALLLKGLVPCVDSGKKTRKYKIKMEAVIAYLEDREIHPEKYALLNSTVPQLREKQVVEISPERQKMMQIFYHTLFRDFPDVVTVVEASKMTGYSTGLIRKWCRGKKFVYFNMDGIYKIPRISLVSYLTSAEHCYRKIKSQKHIEDMTSFDEWLKNHMNNNSISV